MGQSKGPSSPEAIAMRRVVRESDPQALDTNHVAPDAGERQHFLFYQDDGGLRATDETNDNLDTIYYLGIIDILTPYNTLKKLEHCWKGFQADRVRVSPRSLSFGTHTCRAAQNKSRPGARIRRAILRVHEGHHARRRRRCSIQSGVNERRRCRPIYDSALHFHSFGLHWWSHSFVVVVTPYCTLLGIPFAITHAT